MHLDGVYIYNLSKCMAMHRSCNATRYLWLSDLQLTSTNPDGEEDEVTVIVTCSKVLLRSAWGIFLAFVVFEEDVFLCSTQVATRVC